MKTFLQMTGLVVASVLLAAAVTACSGSSDGEVSDSNSNGSVLGAPSSSGGESASGGEPSSSGGNGACASIAGAWTVSGTCGSDVCVISQTGCSTNFKCSDGAASFTGTINGSDVAYAGTTGTGLPGNCRGSISGSTFAGSCTISGQACTYTAKKR